MLKTLALVAAVALSLGGCAHGLTPEQQHVLLQDFKALGCAGTVDIDTGASSGQLGGEAHGSVKAHGECRGSATPAAGVAAPASPAT